jgi:hypothetical protein
VREKLTNLGDQKRGRNKMRQKDGQRE